jgi:predicted metal-dependent hydrolase
MPVDIEKAKEQLRYFSNQMQETKDDVTRLEGKRDALLAQLKERHNVAPKAIDHLKKELETKISNANKQLAKKLEEINERLTSR